MQTAPLLHPIGGCGLLLHRHGESALNGKKRFSRFSCFLYIIYSILSLFRCFAVLLLSY